MKTYRAIVFDLDDTLYPEREYAFSGFRAVAAWAQVYFGIPAEPAFFEMEKIFLHGDRAHVFDQWLSQHDQNTAANIQQLIRVYREHHPVIRPFPEVQRLLTLLKRNHKIGLLSDGYIDVQKRKMAALGLSNYFDLLLFSDEWGREAWKPNPATFRLLLEKLDVSGPEAVYIADNPLKDFGGARIVGMDTIRMRLPGGVYAHESAADSTQEPHYEFNSLAQLELFLLGSNPVEQ